MSIGKTGAGVSFRYRDNFLYRIRNFTKQAWQGYRRWKILKEHCRQLLEMNDYILKDIGISRADAVRYARHRDSLWQCILKSANDSSANVNRSETD